jgi:HD-GYP domain-containing protein (c-di-GMP phosphodiesterase class II)
VGAGAPLLDRMKRLANMALRQKTHTRQLMSIRCERGAGIARQLGFSETVAAGIHSVYEHWDGQGYPEGRRAQEIPILSRIILLAQTLEVFLAQTDGEHALVVARARSGRWFDPDLVKAARALAKRNALWTDLDVSELAPVVALEPGERRLDADEQAIDHICAAFADVIDAKSPFTFRHSTGVAAATTAIAGQLGMSGEQQRFLWRAAMLHDIGKLSVPNTILEKPGKLTPEEWEVVKKHPYYTQEILKRIPGFAGMAEVAAAHHEKLDGSGYFLGRTAEQLTIPMRILAVADIFDALSAKRPYREALPLETVFGILDKDAGRAIDAECLEALKTATNGGEVSRDLANLATAVSTAPAVAASTFNGRA